jgi:ubiquinone/menaquinone biosynthesis C-methylase UbiE
MKTVKEIGESIESRGAELAEQEQLRHSWDQIAEGYDKFVTDTEIWLANEALRRAGLKAGQYFLDVAAGCGGLSLPAARLGAKVLAIDWSLEMIRLFNKRVLEEKLQNARGQVMDGHHLEIEDNLFDLVGSQFGVMLFPDQPRALREMVRVTKPGGKMLLIGYGTPDKVEFLNFFIESLQWVRPDFQGLPSDPPPLEFQIADPTVMYQRLRDAGLKNIQVETVTEKLEFSSGRQFWDWNRSGNPIVGHVLEELGITQPEQISAVIERLDEMIRERSGRNGMAILTNPINIGIGTK